MTLADAPMVDTPVARRRRLRALVRSDEAGRSVGALVVLDVVGAVAFAAGLALMLSAGEAGFSIAGAGLALAGAGVRGAIAFAAASRGGATATLVKARLRQSAAAAALARPAGSSAALGETLSVVVDGVEALQGYVARFAPIQTAAAVSPLIVMVAITLASPVAAAIVLFTFAPFVVGMALAGGAAAMEARRQFEALGRLSGLFVDRLRALPAILAFQREEGATRALGRSAEELARRTLAVLRVGFLSSAVLEFFAALSVALVAVYCGFKLLHLLPFPVGERLDLGRAVFVLALAPEAYLPMRRLAAAYHDRQAAEAAAPALAALCEAPDQPARRALARPPTIRFERVAVVYPDADRPALADFDLTLRPGESVALLGPSGSGKSTVLHLLLGLVQPSAGVVSIDGVPVEAGAPLAAWAGQAPVVIPGSLKDNLALVRPEASAADVESAARRAGLLNVPDALDRRIDERGGGLSGGERRRLGIARALLSDAPLLLMDEPTASLDLGSETLLLPVLAEALRGRTTLIATHSSRVAALADRVVRLAD